MRGTLLVGCLLVVSAAPAQTKTISDSHCEASVPSDWITAGPAAHSADRSFVLIIRGFQNSEIPTVVDGMKQMKAKVVDENASRILLLMPIPGSAKKQYIQITKTSPLACRASITYSADSHGDEARKIAESVTPLQK